MHKRPAGESHAKDGRGLKSLVRLEQLSLTPGFSQGVRALIVD